jgi:hypothetical protein
MPRHWEEKKMKCLKCNNSQLTEQKIRFGPEIKGEIVEVIVPCNICKNCNTPFMDTAQMNVLRRTAADKCREKLDMSQSSPS